MPLPDELVEAVTQAFDREMRELDMGVRAQMLARTRGTLDSWLHGTISTSDAVAALTLEVGTAGG
ncbi:MAG TPA: hypothetical protein VIF15_09205 [Polyangiaceae bacterium]|jgi:hypothetical protein